MCGCVAPLWRAAVWQAGEELLNNTELRWARHTDVFIPWCCQKICLWALSTFGTINSKIECKLHNTVSICVGGTILHLWLAQWHSDVIHEVIKQHLNERSANIDQMYLCEWNCIYTTSYLCGTEMMSLVFSDCSTSNLLCTSLCLLETSFMWNKATFSSSWKQIKPRNHICVTDKTESVCAGFHTVPHQVRFGGKFSGLLRGKNQETCFSSRATSALVDLSAAPSTGWNVGCFYWYNLYVSWATWWHNQVILTWPRDNLNLQHFCGDQWRHFKPKYDLSLTIINQKHKHSMTQDTNWTWRHIKLQHNGGNYGKRIQNVT